MGWMFHRYVKKKKMGKGDSLASPGFVWDSKMWKEHGPPPRVRGGIAPPSSDLAKLVNVGGMTTDRPRFAPLSFVDVAFAVLYSDPLPADLVLPPWRQIPDSAFYARHVAYIVKKGVLWKVPNPDDGVRRWGGRYGAIWKDKIAARATFNLKSTNAMAVGGPEVLFSLLSSQGLIREIRKRDFVRLKLRFVHGDVSNAYYNYGVGDALEGKPCIFFFGFLEFPRVS